MKTMTLTVHEWDCFIVCVYQMNLCKQFIYTGVVQGCMLKPCLFFLSFKVNVRMSFFLLKKKGGSVLYWIIHVSFQTWRPS